MRIGLLIYGSLETLSGGYLYDRQLVASLQQQGDRVEVISLPWRAYGRCLADNFSASLTRRLLRLEVDLLLQDELNHPSLFWLNRRLRRETAYPLAAIVHHLRSSEARPAWQNRLYRWVERQYLRSLHGFVFNSQTTCQTVWANTPKRPAVVAPPAGDRFGPPLEEAEIIRRAGQPGSLRLAFIGALIPRKGLHVLLEALARIAGLDWRLEVAGRADADPKYAAMMQAQAAARFPDGRVQFLGALPDAQMPGWLRNCHLLATPSSYEGFGIVYLEGMGFGLPAIASRAGAAGEIITHDQDGYLIQPGDSLALAAHIAALIQDRQKLVTLSLAARRRFLAHPTWRQSMRRVRPFLQALLEIQ